MTDRESLPLIPITRKTVPKALSTTKDSSGGSGSERELSLWPLFLISFILIFICVITEEKNRTLAATVPQFFLPSNFWVSANLTLPLNASSLVNGTSQAMSTPGLPLNPGELAFMIQLGSLFLLWYLFNVYFNIYNKQVLKVFPYPFTVTLFQFGMGGLISTIMWSLDLYDLPIITLMQVISIIPVALAHTLGNLFTNMSVKDVAVSFTQVIKSMEPFFSVVLTSIVFHKAASIPVLISLLPIVAGVGLASVSEVTFSWSGFLSAMASNLTFQSRNVLSKEFMVDHLTVDNINLFAIITLISFVAMIPATAIKEPQALLAIRSEIQKTDSFDQSKMTIRAVLAAICFHGYQQVSYMILQRVSPITHAVGNCMKRVIVIVASVAFFQTPVSRMNAAGITLAILGVFAYSQAKLIKFHKT